MPDGLELAILCPTAQHCGQIRAALETQGTPIGVNDLHNAAHARSEGLIVVTNNRRGFDRVPVLQIEEWSLQFGGPRPVPKLPAPGRGPMRGSSIQEDQEASAGR
jgi:hypothetical protein